MSDLLAPLRDAFLQVGVFVAPALALVAWLEHRTDGGLARSLDRHRRFGPVLGALAGVVPGCGGALVVVPLYARGRASFGTVVAALVATMGDSSFVLLAVDLDLALRVHGLLLITGIVTGAVVDRLGYAPTPRRPVTPVSRREVLPVPAGGAADVGGPAPTSLPAVPPVAVRTPASVRAFWVGTAVAALVAVPLTFQLLEPSRTVGPVTVGAIADVAGIGGLLACLGVVLATRAPRGRRSSTGTETAREAARITLLVASVFVLVELVVHLGVGLVAALSVAGAAGVLLGAAVGLVPGCAPQILLTGLYATGAVPLPTLLANAVGQDGDALLPMLLLDRRGAVVASLVTTVPAVVVGAGALLLT